MMTRLNTDFRTDGSSLVVDRPTKEQALAQFEKQNHLCSFCAKPLDPSGKGVAVAYDGTPLHMHTLVHLLCKAEIEAVEDQEWLDSPEANTERERLIRRGFSPEMVEPNVNDDDLTNLRLVASFRSVGRDVSTCYSAVPAELAAFDAGYADGFLTAWRLSGRDSAEGVKILNTIDDIEDDLTDGEMTYANAVVGAVRYAESVAKAREAGIAVYQARAKLQALQAELAPIVDATLAGIEATEEDHHV